MLNASASKLRGWTLWPGIAFLVVFVLWDASATTRAQSSPAPAQTADSSAQKPSETSSAEIVSHDEAPTFKVNVNLVQVRVVVRDSKGNVIGNLHKEDFQLFDNRKPQVITQFSEERPGTKAEVARETAVPNPAESSAEAESPIAVPERYIAYVFDDVHLAFSDLSRARMAADRHLDTLRPTDRAAVFTTSGQGNVDFTDDRAKLHDALLHLQPRPIAAPGTNSCAEITYYMADLIQNQHDAQALQVATQDALICQYSNNPQLLSAAAAYAQAMSMEKLNEGNAESHLALTVVNEVIRRMGVLPGQRTMVLVSPGFMTPQMEFEYTTAIDRAVRAQVTVGALDARGLYVVGDITDPVAPTPISQGVHQQYATMEASADADIMAILADGTGGSFFQNSNDLDEGFRRVASAPEYSYVLGFSPTNLKLDGSFHSLKVTLKNGEKLTVQARRGYFAPKHTADPAQEAKQEIEDALFSQEEMRSLPVELHTQFFKSSDIDAKLTVLAHVDVRRLRLRKVDGRNDDELTVVSALFDINGGFLQGIQKTITMRLKDETLEKRMGSGITLKTSFDVKPGNYLVRLVVRDAEAQLVSAQSGAVRIP